MSTVFVVCFLVGLGLSVVSFVSGLEHVSIFDHIFGHRVHVHVPKAVRGAIAKKPHVSPFNAAALTAFLAWFGGTGVVLQQVAHLTIAVTTAVAAGAGMVGASAVNRFIGALVKREKSVETLTMVGTIARVTMPVREGGGTGEIVFTHGGTRQVAGARSDDGRAIAKGTEVVVIRHEKGIAYVATWDELSPTQIDSIQED
jgi:hypothetical protein